VPPLEYGVKTFVVTEICVGCGDLSDGNGHRGVSGPLARFPSECSGAHHGDVAVRKILIQLPLALVTDDFALGKTGRFARIDDDKRFVIQDALQLAQGDIH